MSMSIYRDMQMKQSGHRSFCKRYCRTERSLRSVEVNVVGGMHDSESRGARLLERMRLGLDQQRFIKPIIGL